MFITLWPCNHSLERVYYIHCDHAITPWPLNSINEERVYHTVTMQSLRLTSAGDLEVGAGHPGMGQQPVILRHGPFAGWAAPAVHGDG